MATTDTSALGALLKRLYSPEEIGNLINLESPVLARCAAEGSAQLGGSGFYFPVRVEANEGHSYIAETGDLPAARSSTVLTALVTPKIQAGVAQVSGLAKAVSSGNAMAFARAFDEQVQTLIAAMTAYREGVFFRDGTGVLTQFNGAVATSAGPHTVDDVSHLREGMYVDILDQGDNSTRHDTAAKITAIDWVNRTVTFSASVAAAVDDNDYILITGASQTGTTSGTMYEPIGVEGALLTSGSYLGIDRGTYSNWQANAMTVSAFLDEDVLMRALTRVTQESGIQRSGMRGKMMGVLHPQQLDILFKLAIPRMHFTGNSFDLGYGGDSDIKFGGVGFCTSYQAPTAKGYIGDWSAFKTFYTPNGQLHVDSEYNGSALKWVATKDVGLMFVKSYHAFACKNPQKFIRLASLTEGSR